MAIKHKIYRPIYFPKYISRLAFENYRLIGRSAKVIYRSNPAFNIKSERRAIFKSTRGSTTESPSISRIRFPGKPETLPDLSPPSSAPRKRQSTGTAIVSLIPRSPIERFRALVKSGRDRPTERKSLPYSVRIHQRETLPLCPPFSVPPIRAESASEPLVSPFALFPFPV